MPERILRPFEVADEDWDQGCGLNGLTEQADEGVGVECAGTVRCVDGVDGIAIVGQKIDAYAGASGVTWRAIDPRYREPQGA